MKALIDGDILRYEVGFAAEAAAKAVEEGSLPSWEWVNAILSERLNRIWLETGSDDYEIFLTGGPSFRDEIAVTKPYKGQRVSKKPWHFNNLSFFLTTHFNCSFSRRGLEADDEMAIAQKGILDTVICSRDKDLRQVNGWVYSWELGKQSRWGPEFVADGNSFVGLSKDRRKLEGTGKLWFYGQLLTGDSVDNIPGLEKCGPVKAYEILKDKGMEEAWESVKGAYQERYKAAWKERLEEQGRLLWLIRHINGEVIPLWCVEGENGWIHESKTI